MHSDCYKTGTPNSKKRRRGPVFLKRLFLLCSAALLLGGCRKQQEDTADADYEKIVIGIDEFEPYTYLDENGNFTGIDIDLASLAFHELGYAPEFKIIPWSEKNTLLADGTIDCIWSCYSMNGREDEYQWAGPYLYSRQVIAVRSDSSIQNFDDLAGVRAGVQVTTRAAALFLHTTDSPLPEVKQVNCFATTEDMFAAIRKGYVDAVAGHEALISEFLKTENGCYRLLEESPHVSKAGIAFQKGTHMELAQELDALLREMSTDGTIAGIVSAYGLDAEKVVVEGDTDEN